MSSDKVFVLFTRLDIHPSFNMLGVYSSKEKAMEHTHGIDHWYIREYKQNALCFRTVARSDDT